VHQVITLKTLVCQYTYYGIKRFPFSGIPILFRFLLVLLPLPSFVMHHNLNSKIMETAIKKQFEVAEIQFTYKTKVKPSQRPKITSSKEAYAILLESWDEDKLEFVEQFKVLLLNRANKVLGIYEVSTGGVSGTVADPKLVFAAAINANASDDPFP
jgi:hypothetical protein